MKRKLIGITSAAMLSLTLIACSEQPATIEEPVAEVVTEQQSTAPATPATSGTTESKAGPTVATAIGATTEDAFKVQVTSAFKNNLVFFAIRHTGDTEWGANLLSVNQVIKSKGTVVLGIAADDMAEAYDVKVRNINGTNVEFANVALTQMSAVTLHPEKTDGKWVGYVSFVGLDGSEGTTKQAEGDAAASDNASTQSTSDATTSPSDASNTSNGSTAQSQSYTEPSSGETTYEQPTYEQPSYEEPTYEQPTYEEPAYEEPATEQPTYEEPTYVEPVAEPAHEEPAQSADDCTRDNVIVE